MTLGAGAALAFVCPATAQQTPPPDKGPVLAEADEIAGVLVKGQALSRDNAFSTTAFGAADIKERRVTEIEQLFREVPGMNVRDYNLSGVANQIVIRGFGNGAHGGDLGMVIDGIPLNEANSHADGYVDSTVLIPLEIDRLTVYRGPVSALYGNFNRGGLIAYETRKGGRYAEADASAGDFGSFDLQAALGAPLGGSGQFNGALQAFSTQGFRPQSDAERATASGRLAFAMGSRLDLSVSARVQAAEGRSPAYLTLEQFNRDPYGIDPRVMNDGSEKRFGTFRGDLAYTLAPETRLLAFAYATRQEFSRFFTRGAVAAPRWRQREETYEREVYGLGASLNGRSALASRPVRYVLGLEGFSEDTQFQFYDDLAFRRRTAPAQFNRTLALDSVSAFGEANVEAHRLLELSLGARYDRFTGDCTPDGLEVPGGACGPLETVASLSPKLGARSQILPWLQLRASYSEGFALPEAQAKFATGAQNLDPNQIAQVELGVRMQAGDAFEADLVAYRIGSSNEFASPAPGEFVNFGETLRSGFEAALRWSPREALDLRAVFALAGSEVEQNLNPSLIGREVTGVPDRTATLTAVWTPLPRLRLNAAYRYVGAYATNAANTVYAPSYDLVDLGASYELDVLPVPARLYLAVDNVADEVHASSFNSLGSIAPGSPRFVRLGLQVGF